MCDSASGSCHRNIRGSGTLPCSRRAWQTTCPCGDTPFPKRALTVVKGDFPCARLLSTPRVRRRMWNVSPCPPDRGAPIALSECLLLAANPAAARCSGESVHWKEPVPHEQRPAGTVTLDQRCFDPCHLPPHPHAHAPRMKASGTPALPPDSCSCWHRRFPAKPRTDRLRTVSTLSLGRGPPPRVLSGPRPACPPSVPGVVRKPALHSTVRTSISRREDSPGKTTLNCDASATVHFISTEHALLAMARRCLMWFSYQKFTL